MVDIGVIFFASFIHAFVPSLVALLAWFGSCACAQVKSIAEWFALRVVGLGSLQCFWDCGGFGFAFSFTSSFGRACALPLSFRFAFAFSLGSAVPLAWSEGSLASSGLAAGSGGGAEASFQVSYLIVLVFNTSSCFAVRCGAGTASACLPFGWRLGGGFGATWSDGEEGIDLVFFKDSVECVL